MNDATAPPIPLNVVEYLEKTFPDKVGDRSDTGDDLRWKAAQAHVVRHLRAVYTKQTENFAKRLKEQPHHVPGS